MAALPFDGETDDVARPSGVRGRWAHLAPRHLALAVGGCVALAVVGLVDPSTHVLAPPCPLRALTGLDCPLCGATRATHALLRGDVLRALDFNALYVASLPLVTALLVWWLVTGSMPAIARRARVVRSAVAVAAAFAIARNLPPFTGLGT